MVARNLALISISKVAVFIWAHTSNVTFAVKQSTGTTYDGYLVYPQNSNIKMSKLVGRAGSVYKNGRPVIAKKNYYWGGDCSLSGRMAVKDLGVSDMNMPGALKGRVKFLSSYTFC